MKLLIGLLAAAHALSPQPPKTDATRRQWNKGALATLAAPFVAAAPPAGAVVYLDPARYGDQELKNAAIAKCRTRVRDAIVKDPSIAPSFFLLARARRPSFGARVQVGIRATRVGDPRRPELQREDAPGRARRHGRGVDPAPRRRLRRAPRRRRRAPGVAEGAQAHELADARGLDRP